VGALSNADRDRCQLIHRMPAYSSKVFAFTVDAVLCNEMIVVAAAADRVRRRTKIVEDLNQS
jgi:hypothetical protein